VKNIFINLGFLIICVFIFSSCKKAEDYKKDGDGNIEGNPKLAIQNYDFAIEINPKYEDAYYQRGNAKNKVSDYQGALQDFNNLIKMNPNYFDAYGGRAIAKDGLEDYKGAVEDYNKIIISRPEEYYYIRRV
jgi:tetratricopeptide (TPR) repeat protein